MGEGIGSPVRRVPRPDPRPARPAAPVRPTQPSKSTAPTLPWERALARDSGRLENVELASDHLVSLPDDTEVRIRRLIAEELPPARAAREESTVRVQGPELPLRVRMALVGALSFALVWNVAIGAYRAYAAARDAQSQGSPSTALATAPGPLVPRSASHPCVLGPGGPRTLARSVLVRGGVEAAATESRAGFGVVKGPREGIALELDFASGAVKGSTRVIAGDALLRVLPALEADLPIDAIAETGPLHTVRGSGDDADGYEIGAQAGFLVWRARGRDGASRLWPMTSDVEAPRLVRVGNDRLLVYRREGAIWLGAIEVDPQAARPGSLLRLSDPAATVQVGTPALDGKGDVGVAAWSQRDTRGGGRWALRWTHWRQGAKPGVVRELASPAEGGAIAPSVAVLEGGDFLIAWTEGAAGHHRVRAQLFGPDDEPIGAPLDASATGMDAGQAQVALGGARGAIGYLVARAAGFDLVAAPIACE